MIKKIISRTPVHIIRNQEGGIYETILDKMAVNIRQVETWEKRGMLFVNEKIVPLYTENMTYRRNQILPGNIIRAYDIEPITEDIYEHLLMKGDSPIENQSGNFIYTYLYYDPNMLYMASGHIDESLNKVLCT